MRPAVSRTCRRTASTTSGGAVDWELLNRVAPRYGVGIVEHDAAGDRI
jgi:hypothetical protein